VTGPLLWLLLAAAFTIMVGCAVGLCRKPREKAD
jgi:hypothetical protein